MFFSIFSFFSRAVAQVVLTVALRLCGTFLMPQAGDPLNLSHNLALCRATCRKRYLCDAVIKISYKRCATQEGEKDLDLAKARRVGKRNRTIHSFESIRAGGEEA